MSTFLKNRLHVLKCFFFKIFQPVVGSDVMYEIFFVYDFLKTSSATAPDPLILAEINMWTLNELYKIKWLSHPFVVLRLVLLII